MKHILSNPSPNFWQMFKYGMHKNEAYPFTPISPLLALHTYELLLNSCLSWTSLVMAHELNGRTECLCLLVPSMCLWSNHIAWYHNDSDLTHYLCFLTHKAPFDTNSPVYNADLESAISHASLRADTMMFAARQGNGGGWLLHVRQ